MDIPEKRRKIHRERVKQLDKQIDLWNDGCIPCTKIREGIKAGTIPKGTFKDRPNAVCDACPIQPKLLKIGKALIKLTNQDRALR